MNDKQRRRFERLVRSRDVAAPHNVVFPASSVGGKALANISGQIGVVENLDAARSTSERSARHGTSSRSDTREALHELLASISETAETMALDLPEVKGKFQRPRANINDQNMLATARSYAAQAPPFKARFIEYNMPDDFLVRLNSLIDTFEQSISQQNLGRSGRRANSAAIDAALDTAEQDLERLDIAMRNTFRNDPATLAAWESARRLHSGPRKAKTPTPPPPPK
jgi:hypothetical protein